ncbi:MAG: ankyrin repeat domain-containing protein [Acidobacteriia bacterium]|nr:ankyrin repeat domain-containing protein [Terriglobia bacterium]
MKRLGGGWWLLFVGSLGAFAAPGHDPRLADAAQKGDRAAVRSLVEQKVDVNEPLPDGTTALHWAVRVDDLETADLLLHAGANVKAADRYGLTPLSLACANGSVPMIRKLLDAGANADSADPSGNTALMKVIHTGNVEAARLLIDHGASVNAKDQVAEETPLMFAVREYQPGLVRLLIERGADLNVRTRVGKTPAWRPPNAGGGSHGAGIIRGGWPERGAREATPGGMTALLYASRDGRMDIAQMLVAGKADINQAEADGVTPLLIAVANEHLELAKFLVDHGADVNATDFWGRTPLWETVDIRNLEFTYGHSDEHNVDREAPLTFLKTLLDHGAKVNARTKEVPPIRRWVMPISDLSWADFTGQTPFLRAAQSGDITVMRLLLDHGADPNIPTYAGSTALMAASGINWSVGQTYTESKESLMEAVKLCLQKGADVNTANSMGLTAIFGAVNRGSNEIVEFLFQHGARLDLKDKEGRPLMSWAEGQFLATVPPERKPSTIALLEKLMGQKTVAENAR